ncbi:MAG: hypothetical protein NZ521_08330, partial [Flammeovirgaceae bacterium]|nr:hypothetical protein [Flammeovirgaceae bacterium]MDW8288227.1 hypothetical protein [Flammeovirgaceae bacterium]
MNLDKLIEKILKATYPLEVFTIKNYKKEYLEMVKLLHPDVCHHPKTNDVLIKLNELRRQLEEMLAMED